MTEQGETGGSHDISQQHSQPSLIQQRMQLDRQRLCGLWVLFASAFLVSGQIVNLSIDASKLWAWLGLAVWLVGVLVGIMTLLKSRRALQEFETRHGTDAGRQDHVR